jgi:glutaredoxin
VNVVLYTSAGCHLCDQAKAALRALRVPYEERDAGQDAQLRLRTPVVEAGGVVVAEGDVTAATLRRVLEIG